MKVTIDVVRTAETVLLEMRQQFLKDHGWELEDDRWVKDFPWAPKSTRRVEGCLADAVEYQAAYDARGKNARRA